MNLFQIHVKSFLILFSIFCGHLCGSTITIDADGAADYASLDTAVTSFDATDSYPDTVLFIGTNQDTYSLSVEMTKLRDRKIVFLGNDTNPDIFPIIIPESNDQDTLLKSNEVVFQRLIFTNKQAFLREDPTRPLIFKQCIIRDITSPNFLKIRDGSSKVTRFENCLFVKNSESVDNDSAGIFFFDLYGRHELQLWNCTFDGNGKVFNDSIDYGFDDQFKIQNCIFSNNQVSLPSVSIKRRTYYSLTTETDLSDYGKGCKSGDPLYITFPIRTKPSDWKVLLSSIADSLSSPAIGTGDSNGAPEVDIEGKKRNVKVAGCWLGETVPKPVITVQPENYRDTVGGTASFTITATGSQLNFAWFKVDNTDTLNDTNSLTVPVSTSDSGALYYCVVSNGGGFVSSDTVLLEVITPPVIVTDLSDSTVFAGTTLSLNIISSGLNLSFQWYRNSEAIENSDTNKLVIEAIDTSYNSDTLYCAVTNLAGTATSAKAVLTVKTRDLPAITEQPNSSTVQVAETISISVAAVGSAPLTYTWYKNGLTDSIGNEAVFTIESAELSDAGDYQCVVKNEYGSTISNIATIGVTEEIVRPANNAEISIDNVYVDKVELSWVIPDSDQIDSIRLWSGVTQVPLGFDPDPSLFVQETFEGSVRSFSLDGLNPNTLYYFGIQIKSNDVWSSITVSARDSIQTKFNDNIEQVSNTINITKQTFDRNNNIISLGWTIDTAGITANGLQVGIVYGLDTYPNSFSLQSSYKIIPSDSMVFTGENTTKIYLGDKQYFDTLYYFSAFMRIGDASWSEKSENAQCRLEIPAAQWQEIEYFKGVDSVYILNNSFSIRKGQSYPDDASIIYKDSIDLISDLVVPDNFIMVGKPFKFRNGVSSPVIDLGVRYNSIPSGYSAQDIFLYEYNDGKWYLINRVSVDVSSSMIFTELNLLYGKPEHRKRPHVLLIDKISPSVVITDTADVLVPASDFINRISIKDNCANVRYTLKCGPLHKELTTVQDKQLSDTAFNGIITVKNSVIEIKESNSFRVILIVNDGPNIDTFNISRQVFKSTESMSTRSMKWIPVSMTTELNEPAVEKALLGLVSEGNEWAYDSVQFRLFYWDPSVNNSEDSYVQYSPERADLFKLIPGRVFWVKSRSGQVLKFGAGKTVSIINPFKVTLQARQWTDFAMPYNIALYLADIFNSSPELESNKRESIWFYQFNALNNDDDLVCQPVYCPPIPEFNSELVYLEKESMGTYTIYNATDENIELTIPAIDTINSNQKKKVNKSLQSNGWYFSINAKSDNDIIVPVFGGFRESGDQKSLLPSPPAPGVVHVNIYDTTSYEKFGNVIYHEKADGYTFPVVFTNYSKTETKDISYSIASELVTKNSLNIAVYNASNKHLERNLNDGKISLKPGERAYRWVLVGDTSYIGRIADDFVNVDFSLQNIRTFPGRGAVQVKFTVPFTGVNTVKMRIINQMGKIVCSQSKRNLLPGRNSAVFQIEEMKGLASGTYILQLQSFNSQMKQTGRIQSKFLYISR